MSALLQTVRTVLGVTATDGVIRNRDRVEIGSAYSPACSTKSSWQAFARIKSGTNFVSERDKVYDQKDNLYV